jgi:hypothetical protein
MPQNQVHMQLQINFADLHIYISFFFSSLNQFLHIYWVVHIYHHIHVYRHLWCRIQRYFLLNISGLLNSMFNFSFCCCIVCIFYVLAVVVSIVVEFCVLCFA